MGVQEIIEHLKKCPTPQTRRQIAEAIDYSPERVSKLICKLIKHNEIFFIEYSAEKASKLVTYKLVRRTKFYFYRR